MPNHEDQADRWSSVRELTDEIESRQELRDRQRELKRLEEERKRRNALRERMVAPFLLVITVLIGLVLWMLQPR